MDVLKHELLELLPSVPIEYLGKLGGGHRFHLKLLSAPVRS
jgi:hypothetical protein